MRDCERERLVRWRENECVLESKPSSNGVFMRDVIEKSSEGVFRRELKKLSEGVLVICRFTLSRISSASRTGVKTLRPIKKLQSVRRFDL